jgi:hypothetical protein
VAWYAILGMAGHTPPLLAAGGLTLMHTLVSQRKAAGDAAALKTIFDRFERLQAVRATLQVFAFAAMLWALVSR